MESIVRKTCGILQNCSGNGREIKKVKPEITAMQDATSEAFIILFTEAFKKCFAVDLHTTLSETECKHFSNQILEETGLVIGAKSLKNYSSYVLNPGEAKPENLLLPL